MRYYENIILHKNVDIDLEDIKDMLEEGKSVFNLYCVCVRSEGSSIMEIMTTTEILKEVNSQKDYGILAFAKGKSGAYEIVKELILDWLNEGMDLRSFKHYYNRKCS